VTGLDAGVGQCHRPVGPAAVPPLPDRLGLDGPPVAELVGRVVRRRRRRPDSRAAEQSGRRETCRLRKRPSTQCDTRRPFPVL
jgi:hypothetical protein